MTKKFLSRLIRMLNSRRFLHGAQLAAFAGVSLLTRATFAAEHEGGESAHAMNWPELLGQTFTFIVFAVGIALVAKKSVVAFLAGRHTAVKKAVEEAREAKRAAEAKYAEYQKKMADFDLDLKRLEATFRAQADEESVRLKNEAEKAAERIRKDAEASIALELERAKSQLRQDAAEHAVAIAGEILRREMRDEDHHRLVSEFMGRLGTQKANNKEAA